MHMQAGEALVYSPRQGWSARAVVHLLCGPPALPSLLPRLLSSCWQGDSVQDCFPPGLPVSVPRPARQVVSELGHLDVCHLVMFKPSFHLGDGEY